MQRSGWHIGTDQKATEPVSLSYPVSSLTVLADTCTKVAVGSIPSDLSHLLILLEAARGSRKRAIQREEEKNSNNFLW